MSLPHIQNSQAGRSPNYWEPVHNSLFEVQIDLPTAVAEQFGSDQALLTEHVKSVSGLDGLTKGPGIVQQKFMGTSRSYLAPKLDDTSYEVTVTFTLNLRNATDNYIFKLFQAWNKLGYDLATGETTLKKDYVAKFMRISIGNRAGDIFREIIFKDIIIADGFTTQDQLDYSSNEPIELQVKFKSDWAVETNL